MLVQIKGFESERSMSNFLLWENRILKFESDEGLILDNDKFNGTIDIIVTT